MLALSCTDEEGDRRATQLLIPVAWGKQQLLWQIVTAALACLGSSCLRERRASPPRASPGHTPLVDFPEGGILDPFNLLNGVERHCIGEEAPDLLKLF